MKRCPTCDAPADEDALFCEVDGTRLPTAHPPVAAGPAVPAGPRCPGCGAENSNDDDGYCASCGLRLPTHVSTPPLPPGSKVGAFMVSATRAGDDREAVDDAGSTVLLVAGGREADAILAAEHAALERLADAWQAGRGARDGRWIGDRS